MSSEFKPSNSIALFDVSGNAAIITSGVGLNTTIGGTTIRAGATAANSASGGVELGSGAVVYGVDVKTVSGVVVWVGGAPFSGNGYPLYSGQTFKINVRNLNQIRIVGAASGTIVNYIGVDV